MNVHPGQLDLWNDWHSRTIADDPEPFHHSFRAQFLREIFEQTTAVHVLELGCGQGMDSIYFAKEGCDVDGLDFSPVAIEAANALAAASGLSVRFSCRDITRPLPYDGCQFDGVFSYLSLHYFDNDTTDHLLGEIFRVLVPGGIFSFCVRSVEDPLFARGTRIGRNMFSNDGHVRHFFSVDDVRYLLRGWNIICVGRRRVHYLDDQRPPGGIVHAMATKPLSPETGDCG